MTASPLRVVRDRITRTEVLELAESLFGDMVKAVVEVERSVMVVGGELHSDEEAWLLVDGSAQGDVWGINLSRFVTDECTKWAPRTGGRSLAHHAAGRDDGERRQRSDTCA